MAEQTYYVRFKDGTSTVVAGVQSETLTDETIYDLTNYRNELDSSYLGRAWASGSPSALSNEPEAQDDRFTATAPANEAKMRSRLNLWSGTTGSGDRLFSAWCDEIRGYSIGAFTRV